MAGALVPKGPKGKNIFDIAYLFPNNGAGMRVARHNWDFTPGKYFLLTKVALTEKDPFRRRGKAYGIPYWNGKPVGPEKRITSECKRTWHYLKNGTVWVKKLPPTCTEEEVKSLFEGCSDQPLEISMRNRLCNARVVFPSREAAERAIQILNGSNFSSNGYKVNLELAGEKEGPAKMEEEGSDTEVDARTLIVNRLPPNVTVIQVVEFFRAYHVTSQDAVTLGPTIDSAYVTFESHEAASRAAHHCAGKAVRGAPVSTIAL
eukprot:CAMPEP_0177660432 /NCGR_PEP_ID=MMETSP0447-20121125/18039_1 /TAXON_ID=0 /ORGANISM="Stygamoeba regulata, Strain BSH-02190019" /LENGTH=260 /DNA_ID=CAMNT_0019165501 /DNA_START=33 /DNA_END=815 /DNA_ORIENTATION=-